MLYVAGWTGSMPCSLELTDPGFNYTVLSEFRTRLVALTAEERFLEAIIDLCKERGWIKARGHQRTDSTHVLAKIRAMNRTECALEAARQREQTEEFKQLYAGQAGVEGDHAQGVRQIDLMRPRYIAEKRIYCQHVAILAILSVYRLYN